VGRWYDGLEIEGGAPAPDRELMREVNHATGNLVHRLFYWADLLGEGVPARDAQEAVEHLKSSLGELHRLVTRSLDLVRDVEIRPVGITVTDLVDGVALRFGTKPDWSESPGLEEDLAGREVTVDPLLVDRGVGLLVEAVMHVATHEGTGACDVSALRVRRADVSTDPGEREGVFLHVTVKMPERRDENAGNDRPPQSPHVEDAVTLALARKLLTAQGWLIDVERSESERRVVLFVPVSPPSSATVSLSLT
jgi:hypothetical protein